MPKVTDICKHECAAFYETPSQSTYGSIDNEHSCAYCLKWYGPGVVEGCPCNMDSFCDTAKCLKNVDTRQFPYCASSKVTYFSNNDPDNIINNMCTKPLQSINVHKNNEHHMGVL